MNSLPILYYPDFEPNQRWLRAVLLLVDEVTRIIPRGVNHVDSAATRSLRDVLPTALQTISPTEEDKFVDNINFQRLRKAFQEIKDSKEGLPEKSMNLIFHQDGTMEARGNAWLSNEKLETRVRDLMMEYDLAVDVSNPFLGRAPFENAVFANEEAAGLIVSYIADRISRRTGLDTMTDKPLAFTLRSLDALGASESSIDREGEGALASAVAEIVVPASVEQLSTAQYLELRKSYEEVRATFSELVRAVAAYYRLPRSQSGTGLERRLEAAVLGFRREWETYKKRRRARAIKEWAPMCIGGLVGIASTAVSPLLAAGLTGFGFTVTVVEKCMTKDAGPYGQGKCFDMLCRLETQIMNKSDLRRLI